jgi:hypothetical protein
LSGHNRNVVTLPDIGKAIAGLQANAALLEGITEDTKGGGLIHHTFVAGEVEIVVIDEWETSEQFQSFFEGNAKIAKITELVGVTGPPAVAIYNELEAPGKV